MASDIRTATVAYDAGGATLNSYLAWDASQQGPAQGGVNQGHASERPQGFNKNRRRRHGHRKPDGAPEPGGPPKGE